MKPSFGILTISDRSFRGEREDKSGPDLKALIQQSGWEVSEIAIVPDEIDQIKRILLKWCQNNSVHIILTTGGTGFTPRDVTPEATKAILEKETPGLCEAMRSNSLQITPHAMLSRAVAGIRGKTLVINLPGSPSGAVENFMVIKPVLEHAVELILGEPGAEMGHIRPNK